MWPVKQRIGGRTTSLDPREIEHEICATSLRPSTHKLGHSESEADVEVQIIKGEESKLRASAVGYITSRDCP